MKTEPKIRKHRADLIAACRVCLCGNPGCGSNDRDMIAMVTVLSWVLDEELPEYLRFEEQLVAAKNL